jgi:NACHT conflict system protein
MSIETILLTQLTLAAAKFLFKRYLGEKGDIVSSHGEVLHDGGLFGEAGDVVVDVLADLAKDKIKDAIDRMEAVGNINRYALKVVRQIQSRLDQEAKDDPLIDSKGIAEQLMLTLQADLSTGLLLKHDLEPRRLVEAYISLRPLPRGVLNLDSDLAYERMLDHAVQCVVGVASQLPDFQPQAMVESLRRLRQLDDNVEKVLQQLARVTREVQRLAETGDPQRFEIEYRQAVAKNFDFIDLFGITIRPELRRFQLTEAFVSLNLQRSLTRIAHRSQHREWNERTKCV